MTRYSPTSADPLKGRRTAGDVAERAWLLLDLRQSSTQYIGGRLAWVGIKGDTRIAAGWVGDGATPKAIFMRRSSSPRLSVAVVLTSSTTMGDLDLQGIARGDRVRLRREASASASPLEGRRNDYLAVHAVANGRSSARGKILAYAGRILTYRVGAIRPPTIPPPTGRKPRDRRWRRRSGHPAEEPFITR